MWLWGGAQEVLGEGPGFALGLENGRVWSCVCNAPEECDRPALGPGSWAGKGAQKV